MQLKKSKTLTTIMHLITERGSMFGYQDLLVDFRGVPVMKEFAPLF